MLLSFCVNGYKCVYVCTETFAAFTDIPDLPLWEAASVSSMIQITLGRISTMEDQEYQDGGHIM